MVQRKKKTKAATAKQSKRVAKKAVRSKATKKAATTKKKSKGTAVKKKSKAASEKRSGVVKRNTKIRKEKDVPQEVTVPQVMPPNEVVQPPTMGSDTMPDAIEKHKLLEHQFENHAEVTMKQENQRVKSAMANRQATKRIFHTQRHS